MELHNEIIKDPYPSNAKEAEAELATKTKLRKMRTALVAEQSKDKKINIKELKEIYDALQETRDYIKSESEKILFQAGENLKYAGEIAFTAVVGPPFLLYLLLSGNYAPH